MVEFIWLSIVGAVVLLATGSIDYYYSRLSSDIDLHTNTISQDTSEIDVPPIGESPSKQPNESENSILILIGYLVGVVLQIPALMSLVGII